MDRGDAAGVTQRLAVALTIAGSDSGGGAGIQADLKTFAALGVHGASVVTALTAQNTKEVRAIHYPPPEIVTAQIEAVLEDFAVSAIKIGMLGSAEIVGAVARALRGPLTPHPSPTRGAGRAAFIVYDPVMIASSGAALSGAGFCRCGPPGAAAARRLPDPQSRRGRGAARRKGRRKRSRHGAPGGGAAEARTAARL